MKNELKSFVFYESWLNVVEKMDAEDELAFYRAIISYGMDGIMPNDTPFVVQCAMMFVQSDIDQAKEHRDDIRAKNRKRIQDYWDKKRQGNTDTTEYHGIPRNTSENNNVNGNGNVNGNVNGNGNAISTDVDNNIKEKEVKRKIFVKPTAEELQEYINEYAAAKSKEPFSAEKWLAHYESIDWMIGKNKMKDWKAAVRTWFNNQYSNGNSSTTTAKSKRKEDFARHISDKLSCVPR